MHRFYNALSLLSVVLAPVAMMALLGWEAYSWVLADTGIAWLALLSGIATAGVLESVGIVAGETALQFHARRDPRWRMAAAVLLLYVIVGLVLLWRTPLVLLPLLAGAIYILAGLRAQGQHEAETDTARARAQTEWDREQWRVRQQDCKELRLKELELAQSQHSPVRAGFQAGFVLAEPLPSHECEDCGRAFPTVQAINAHRRFCRGPIPASQNGHAA